MRIHKEGFPILIAAAIVLAVVNWLVPQRVQNFVALVSMVVYGFLVQFFRNPERDTPAIDDAVISPADGVVVVIERVREEEFFGEERLKVAIFMRVVDVHVNRVPFSGKLIHYKYHPGKYLMAFHPKSSELNERNTMVFERADGQQVLMRQIAGILARRICFYLKVGQQVEAGQELGFIRFGSRCDLYLPLDAKIEVGLQQVVKGGETVIARI